MTKNNSNNPTEKNFQKMDELLTKFFKDRQERDQAQTEIQKTIDYEVVGVVCDNLPEEKHEEFVNLLADNPNDGEVVKKYLDEKGITGQVEAVLQKVSHELVNDLETQLHDETSKEPRLGEPMVGKEPVK